MFGFEGISVSLVFILLILSTLLCVVYGAINWNNDGDTAEFTNETNRWNSEEKNIESSL